MSKASYSVPLLFTILVFKGYSLDVTPANNKGRLHSVGDIVKCLDALTNEARDKNDSL